MAAADGTLMLRVTWEWLGFERALDLANTVAVVNGVEHDLLSPPGEYERWAAAVVSAGSYDAEAAEALRDAKADVLRLRAAIRQLMLATAAGEELPESAVGTVNAVSRRAPVWPELDRAARKLVEKGRGSAIERLLAEYARSAIAIAADGSTRLNACPAPSCGMFYRPSRRDQHWCSPQCGTRARVARSYDARRAGRT